MDRGRGGRRRFWTILDGAAAVGLSAVDGGWYLASRMRIQWSTPGRVFVASMVIVAGCDDATRPDAETDAVADASAADSKASEGTTDSDVTDDADDAGETTDAETDDDLSSDPEIPAVATPEAIAAFLASEGYLGESWRVETETPRDPSTKVSPHGRVRVHFNQTLLDSIEAGNGTLDGPGHVAGSMAIKRLFDFDDVQVGTAVMLKLDEDGEARPWAYYCEGPEDRCLSGKGPFTREEPAFGFGFDIGCGSCHAGMVFTEFP